MFFECLMQDLVSRKHFLNFFFYHGSLSQFSFSIAFAELFLEISQPSPLKKIMVRPWRLVILPCMFNLGLHGFYLFNFSLYLTINLFLFIFN